MDERLPAYPPPEDAWPFPVSAVTWRRWLLRGAIAVALSAVLGVVGVVVYVTSTQDDPDRLDDSTLRDVVATQCEILHETVRSMPVTGTLEEQADGIRAHDLAITAFVEAVRGVGAASLDADRPARRWLADWERLVDVREAYATGLESGSSASLRLPTDDADVRLDARLDAVLSGAAPACVVPRVLVSGRPADDTTT